MGPHSAIHSNYQAHKSYLSVFAHRIEISVAHSLHAYLQSVKNVFLPWQFPSPPADSSATQHVLLYVKGGSPLAGFHVFAAAILVPLIGIIIIMSDEGARLSNVNWSLSVSYRTNSRVIFLALQAASLCLFLARV